MPDQNGDNGDFDHAFFVVFELTKAGLDQIFVHVFGWCVCVCACVCMWMCVYECVYVFMCFFVWIHSTVT